MRGNRAKLGISVARSSASRSSKAKAASASVRNAAMATSLFRRLAVSSTRYSASATLLGGFASLGGRGTSAVLLKLDDGSIGAAGAARLDVGDAAPGIVD